MVFNPLLLLMCLPLIGVFHLILTKKDPRVVAFYYANFIYLVSLMLWAFFDYTVSGFQYLFGINLVPFLIFITW